MRIEDLRSEKKGDRARVAATVLWEDCDRPRQEVYFETDEAFSDSLCCNPHAFLIACLIPAMHYGEKRVFIDAEICPELRDGLVTVMSWLRQWYYKADNELVQIDVKVKQNLPDLRKPVRAGLFFSGGIDSFAALRANRLNFPLQHPRSIRDGLLVYGLEQDDPELFELVVNSLSEVARDSGITLIPVYTNLYLNYREEDAAHHFSFWGYEFGGAALAAVAHAFARRFTAVSIAATYHTSYLEPWGSHPLLDPNYSSSDLRILHDGIALSRFDKTKLIAEWDPALKHLRVCNKYKQYRAGMFNCGRCEKCIRTMLTLLALGVLDKTQAFPTNDVSAELVLDKVDIHKEYIFLAPIYEALIGPLTARGRHDLAEAIQYVIAHKRQLTWKEKMLQFDRRYFRGNLLRVKRVLAEKR
jgi:hypothetical protein